MGPRFRGDDRGNYFFAAAARSTKVLPPFILWVSGASLIWITTASASTPRFFTSAWVMSRIMPAFCSSVRPAAMLTVISGILSLPLFLVQRSFSYLLPLWEKVARIARCEPDEGSLSAETDPSPGFASRSHPLPQGERVNQPHFTSCRASTSRTLATISSSLHENCA